MRSRILLLAVLIGIALPWNALAQAGAGAASPVTALPDYKLGQDDALAIVIMDHPEISSPAVVVPPDGKISLPLLAEQITVMDMTIPDLTKLLTEKYRKYLVNPYLTVTLTRKRAEYVTLSTYTGSSTMEYHPNLRISELVSQKATSTTSLDMAKVTLTHKDGSKQALDLTNLAQKVGTDADVILTAFDIVFIPKRIAQISVLGEVTRPGAFDYVEGMTVLGAITAAGGVTEAADLAGSTITMSGTEGRLDLYKLLKLGEASQDRAITVGTVIMVPEIRNRTYIFGEVTKPGYYNFKPGDRLLDALNYSAPLQSADLGRVNVIHVDKQANTAVAQVVNIKLFLERTKPDLSKNVALAAGDVIFIPGKRKSFGVQDLLSMMSGLNLVNSTAGILSHGLGSYRY
jgi:protein involved in polysaccharide export with SLBB domain